MPFRPEFPVRLLKTPKLWLGAGIAVFVASLGVAYHSAQVAADQVIALRSPPVLIQSYKAEPGGEAGPVRLLAEADADAVFSISIDTDGMQQSAIVHPLYAVSAEGADSVGLAAVEPSSRRVLGLLVQAAGPDTAFDAEILGTGRYGTVVEVAGIIARPETHAAAVQALSDPGGDRVTDLLSVRPVAADRLSAAAPAPLNDLRIALQWLAAICVAVSALLVLRPYLPAFPLRGGGAMETPRPVSRHRSFAPIVSQDEIAMAEARAAIRGILPRPILRLVDRLRADLDGAPSFRSRR